MCTVRPFAASYSARAARGSMACGISRLLTKSTEAVCVAAAKAAVVASASPSSQSKAMLFGASSKIWCAPSSVAPLASVTTGRGS